FPDATYTEAHGINDRGQVVGEYGDTAGAVHGFRWEQGRFTSIDVPGSSCTSASGINDEAQVVGVRTGPCDSPQIPADGFLLSGGAFATFDVAGGPVTDARGINDQGMVVGGTYSDLVNFVGAHGFLLADGVQGPVTPVDVPGAPRTLALGINDRGQVVGAYENPASP
ncbi:MAG: hypothetical protein J2P45_12650, partial [Candidatus Dormibacteraeota bacterium]|nr:hypothetical protein [Candidatus Dormibacteraeota bacterium]